MQPVVERRALLIIYESIVNRYGRAVNDGVRPSAFTGSVKNRNRTVGLNNKGGVAGEKPPGVEWNLFIVVQGYFPTERTGTCRGTGDR
jgi:hypothetical protein